MLSAGPMFYKKYFQFLFIFFLIFPFFSLKAEETRIGLASYEIISPENQDYLRKVVETSLFTTLREKNPSSTIVNLSAQGNLKDKKLGPIFQREKLSTLIVGSLLKVGNRFEVALSVLI